LNAKYDPERTPEQKKKKKQQKYIHTHHTTHDTETNEKKKKEASAQVLMQVDVSQSLIKEIKQFHVTSLCNRTLTQETREWIHKKQGGKLPNVQKILRQKVNPL
jgi:hypothetical protein